MKSANATSPTFTQPPSSKKSARWSSILVAHVHSIPDGLTATVPGGVPSAGTFQFGFGVDPTLNPELAMVRFQIKTTFSSTYKLSSFSFF